MLVHSDVIVNFASFVTVPIRFASFTIASNASCCSGLTDSKKRDCVSLNNSVTASPDNVTVAPMDVSPNTDSDKATAKPPSDKS